MKSAPLGIIYASGVDMATMIMTSRNSGAKSIWLQECVAWDSLLLAGICLADMLSTLYLVHSGAAYESNPMLAECLRHGYLAFCAQKLCSFLPLLLFCAYYRARRPRLIAIALRGTAVLYVLFYVVAVLMATYG